MKYLDLTFEILTPAFLSGADQKGCEFRSATMKGLVRWWWRANQAPTTSLEALAQAEGALFGSAELKLKSPLSVSVRQVAGMQPMVTRGASGPRSSARYSYQRKSRERGVESGQAEILHYLGYGPMRLLSRQEREAAERDRDPVLLDPSGRVKRDVVYIRPAFAAGAKFVLTLAWRAGNLSPAQEDELSKACAAWAALGGIGCRSRKGYGALGLVEVAGSDEKMVEGLKKFEKEFLEKLRPGGSTTEKRLPKKLPGWPNLAYFEPLFFDNKGDARWEETLGRAGLFYKSIRPGARSQHRWTCGDASPRRASSVFVTVKRFDGRLHGVVFAIPSQREEGRPTDEREWLAFRQHIEEHTPLR